MGMCFLYGSGGGAGTAVELIMLLGGIRPETAKENTVWVDCDAATGAYILSPNEPEGTEGLLWLRTGDSGVPIEIAASFPLVLLLSGALVFHEEKWSAVTQCDVYTGGGWQTLVEPPLKLYNSGDLCESATGGWNTVPLPSSTQVSIPEYLPDCVYFSSKDKLVDTISTVKPISLAEYGSVVIDWSVESVTTVNPDMSLYLSFYDEKLTAKIMEFAFGVPGERRTDRYSVASLTGAYYVAVRTRAYQATSAVQLKAHLYGLQLERYGVEA